MSRIKLSRGSQARIEALVRAAQNPKTTPNDLRYFKQDLEKHVAQLEFGLASASAASYAAAQRAVKTRRMSRVANEQRDADIVVLRRTNESQLAEAAAAKVSKVK